MLPKVPETFKKLINSEGNFRVPTVFLTNAGNGLTQEKAQQLSDWLQIKVRKNIAYGNKLLGSLGYRGHNYCVVVIIGRSLSQPAKKWSRSD